MRTQIDADIDTDAGATSTIAARVAASIQRYRDGAQRQQDAGDDRYGCGCRWAAVPADGTGSPRCSGDLTPWCPRHLAEHVRGRPACDF